MTHRLAAAALAAFLALGTGGLPLGTGTAARAATAAHKAAAHAATAAHKAAAHAATAAHKAAHPDSAAHAAQAAAAAEIPCPKPKLTAADKPKNVPPRPVPPPDNPPDMVVGGAALATHGLVVPPGVRPPPAVTATTWMVADLDTGQVLGGCGPHVYQTPASVQKTLLAATVMDKLDPKQVITAVPSDLDIEVNSSAVGIVPGGRYPIATLWLGLLLNSGNDAANALARLAGGGGPDGVAKTVAAMNAEAKRLGAFQTHAVTPSGLDGKGQFTSAYDLALIAREDFAKPDFRRYVLTRTAYMPAQPKLKKPGFQFQNENKLIYNYPGAMGGKTGFTTVARTSYMSAAQRNGRRLVVTLLGAEYRPLRGWQQGEALLNWGFSLPKDASVGTLVTPEQAAARHPIENATVKAAPGVPRTRAAAGPPRLLSLAAAAAVAVVLAAAPLVLLRLRGARKPTRPQPPPTS